MSSSDDEGTAVPQTVSNYHFVDENEEPVSFSVLPIHWAEEESPESKNNQVFLHGTADGGLQKVYQQVKAWRFDLSNVKPEISVLSKENYWIKLEKPRKSFEGTIRTILITVQCLHFMKYNPEMPAKSLWDHLSKVFSLYEVRPSENDLVDHTLLISEALKRDESVAKSKFLLTFLDQKPKKRKALEENVQPTSMAGFIVDEILDVNIEDNGSESDEEDQFDSVCAICDNGGELLCCEGKCMRSFHATVDAGAESMCKSLGLSNDEVEAIEIFYCKNCQYKQHQCFFCGKLGSSDDTSGAEVFKCVSATCGRFYHPHCVAKLLHREDETAAENLQKKIASGEKFTCPIHKCYACKQGENKMEPDLQFAVCRRCPRSYHRKCLPGKISFEDNEDEDILQRAWEGLLPNRILIYCLKHEIDEEIGTPVRNHIIFPDVEEKKRKPSSDSRFSKERVLSRRGSFEYDRNRTIARGPKDSDNSEKSVKKLIKQECSKISIVADASKKSVPVRVEKTEGGKTSLRGEKITSLLRQRSKPAKPGKQDTSSGEIERTMKDKPLGKKLSSSPLQLDADAERRIVAIMKDSTSSITLDEVLGKHKLLTTHTRTSKYAVDKTITQGKVEGSVEALRTAVQKLEEGGSIEDAKAVCEPQVLTQIIKWKNKLKVYLAPFLHGMRYTSFGRHFTKVEKLKEIVDILHWYVQEGDTIVDFCCGSNDFSCLMKKKLQEMGKKCSFKNYDLITPKNDFNFEQRDWMSVHPRELPAGSNLIMGLNPPFGVKASLANKFIDKALEFKPKLLILIVPTETERLDIKQENKVQYHLVWEDNEKLSGKSFYLPGSVDVNDKQMEQWNVNPPMLCLWSRHDWISTHKSIAQKQGHLSKTRRDRISEENRNRTSLPDHSMEEDAGRHFDNDILIKDNFLRDTEEHQGSRRFVEEDHNHKKSPIDKQDDRKGQEMILANRSPRKRKRSEEKHGNETGDMSLEEKWDGGWSIGTEMYKGSNNNTRYNLPSDDLLLGMKPAVHDGTQATNQDDIGRRYRSRSNDRFSGTHKMNAEEHLMRYGSREGTFFTERESDIRSHIRPYGREGLDFSERSNYLAGKEDVPSQARLYGQEHPYYSSQRSSYLVSQGSNFGPISPSSYGLLAPSNEPSYTRMSTSTMDRYAPKLDELNHTRIIGNGSEPPVGGADVYDPTQPGFTPNSRAFAPRLHGPTTPNSSGWINE